MVAVVTGASGHIGANLVRSLLDRGDRVRVVAHRNTRPFDDLDVEVRRGDVLDLGSLVGAFEGGDIVYHLAAVISIEGDPDGMVHRRRECPGTHPSMRHTTGPKQTVNGKYAP